MQVTGDFVRDRLGGTLQLSAEQCGGREGEREKGRVDCSPMIIIIMWSALIGPRQGAEIKGQRAGDSWAQEGQRLRA